MLILIMQMLMRFYYAAVAPELTCEENKKDVKQIKPFSFCFSNDCPLGGWPPLSPPLGHFCAPALRFFRFLPPRSWRKRTYSAVWGKGTKHFPRAHRETVLVRVAYVDTMKFGGDLRFENCLYQALPRDCAKTFP
jgi:hypothetical protein